MSVIAPPPVNSLMQAQAEGQTRIMPVWQGFFSDVFRICFSLTQSGTTANRPVTNLWPGRMYYDTSLGANGKPIWVNATATGWVLADGTAA